MNDKFSDQLRTVSEKAAFAIYLIDAATNQHHAFVDMDFTNHCELLAWAESLNSTQQMAFASRLLESCNAPEPLIISFPLRVTYASTP